MINPLLHMGPVRLFTSMTTARLAFMTYISAGTFDIMADDAVVHVEVDLSFPYRAVIS